MEGKCLENVSLYDQNLIALTELRQRMSGDLRHRRKWIKIKIATLSDVEVTEVVDMELY